MPAGGKREGSGRKTGSGVKTEKILGYKYTTEEFELIDKTLKELKAKYKTTSKAILELCKFYQNNK